MLSLKSRALLAGCLCVPDSINTTWIYPQSQQSLLAVLVLLCQLKGLQFAFNYTGLNFLNVFIELLNPPQLPC